MLTIFHAREDRFDFLEAVAPFIEDIADAAPLIALVSLMLVLAYLAPVVRFFGAASVFTAVAGLMLLKLTGIARQPKNMPPSQSDPDLTTVDRTIRPYDRDMDEFWRVWKARK